MLRKIVLYLFFISMILSTSAFCRYKSKCKRAGNGDRFGRIEDINKQKKERLRRRERKRDRLLEPVREEDREDTDRPYLS